MIVLRDRYDVLVARDCSWEPSQSRAQSSPAPRSAVGRRGELWGHEKNMIFLIGSQQEGEVNKSDLADPMIPAIMTSRRKKRANAQIFENGVVASGLNNFFRWTSSIIPASGGVVFGS